MLHHGVINPGGVRELYHAVCSFNWRDTQQGFAYWFGVGRHLHWHMTYAEVSNPPPIPQTITADSLDCPVELNDRHRSLLSASLDWSATPQGHGYWWKLFKILCHASKGKPTNTGKVKFTYKRKQGNATS